MSTFPYRSLLYVPAHEPHFVARAGQRGADAVVLDLEDGVPELAKDEARAALAEAVPRLAAEGVAVLVRVDARWRRAWRDLEAAVAAGAHGVMLPKVREAGMVKVVSDYLGELEQAHGLPVGAIRLITLLEDAAGLLAARQVAACPRVQALLPGNLDLAHELGVAPGSEVFAATHAGLLLAARAEGKALIGTLGGGAELRDMEAFRRTVQRARAFGFEGVTCFHPAQVAVVHEVFAPDPNELAAAARILEAFEAAGGGAVAVDGHMVDRPVAERARALLARAGQGAGRPEEEAGD